MEQNEKYYVPDLSEFHVGFEYEEYLPSFEAHFSGNVINTSKWVSKKCNDIIANNLSHNIDMGLIRVKRLDHNDIVKEGWEYKDGVLPYYIFTLTNGISFSLAIEDGIIEICQIGEYIFQGEIHNKSELRFIMNRLGIKK